jgi:hypothetical protein
MKPKHPHGPPITLGNMRELGVQRLVERESIAWFQITSRL